MLGLSCGMQDPVPQSGIERRPPAMGAQSQLQPLDHQGNPTIACLISGNSISLWPVSPTRFQTSQVHEQAIYSSDFFFFFAHWQGPHLPLCLLPSSPFPSCSLLCTNQPLHPQIKDFFQSLSYLVFFSSLYSELLEERNHVFFLIVYPLSIRVQAHNKISTLGKCSRWLTDTCLINHRIKQWESCIKSMYLAPYNPPYPLISLLHSQNLSTNKHHFLVFLPQKFQHVPHYGVVFDNLSN